MYVPASSEPIIPSLNEKDDGDWKRPTKAIREAAVFLVERIGIDPDAMILALAKAQGEIARFYFEEYYRKKKELMEKQKELTGVEDGAVQR